MRKLFSDQFRIESVRMKGYDYSRPGYYLVTICTKVFRRDFGVVYKGLVSLSETGELAEMTWRNIPVKFDMIELDDFIFMPDHMHGIIRITERKREYPMLPELPEIKNSAGMKNIMSASANESRGGVTGLKNPMLSDHSLGKVVRWFKGASSYYIHHKIDKSFAWHPRYYDGILRSQHDLDLARQYIRENPKTWKKAK